MFNSQLTLLRKIFIDRCCKLFSIRTHILKEKVPTYEKKLL